MNVIKQPTEKSGKANGLYLARDKDGTLGLFTSKPICFKESGEECFEVSNDEPYMELNPENFPEITFENSPVKVKLVTKSQLEEEFNRGVKFATDLTLKLLR